MAKTETVQHASDGWAFMHPSNGEWTGSYKTRSDARAARAALVAHAGGAGKPLKKTAAKAVDNVPSTTVDSSSVESAPSEPTSPNEFHTLQEQKIMTQIIVTLDSKTRKSTSVVYNLPDGLRGSERFAKTQFAGGVAPSKLVISIPDGESATFATPKAKMTKEERKAARANAPKQTPAEKLAKLQERAAKLQAKIAAGANA